jgi:Cu/Ag efflux protein CusF
MRKPNEHLSLVALASICLLLLAAMPAAADETISGSGTLNAVKAAERKVNISHDPIPELKWPAMTMDFELSEGVSTEDVEVGSAVVFELHKESDGSFVIESLEPAHMHGH